VNGHVAAPSELVEAGGALIALRNGQQTSVRLADERDISFAKSAGDGTITAPMHGKVLLVSVAKGDTVEAGQRLMVLEAMKMEHALTAPFAGKVAELAVAAGDQVSENATLVVIAPATAKQPAK